MFSLMGSTTRFNPMDYRKLTLEDLQPGMQLVELADARSPWGRIAIRAGLGDALHKGVPCCQHTGITVIKNGQLHLHEALFTISENPMAEKTGWYVVLRLRDPDRAVVESQAIAWGRTRLGRFWGVKNGAIMAWNYLWAWTGFHYSAPESDSLVCSNHNAEMWDHGGHPVYRDGTEDDEVAPWDFLTPEILQHFDVVGTLDLSRG